jgi:hypothetical protein
VSSASVSRLAPPGSFEPELHFYPKVLNAQIHPLVRHFMSLGNERVAERYCHLHPEARRSSVRGLLNQSTRWFRWGGADLFLVTTESGLRRLVVIETNSSPSGNKSMPRLNELSEEAGYQILLERSFMPMLRRRALPKGDLAVLYDKNLMESSGYAATLADLSGEDVHLVRFHEHDPDPPAKFDASGVLQVRVEGRRWRPIRAALRYVTQRPWNRIPAITKTALLNPVLACLAGGRNKLMAAKAYDFQNSDLRAQGLGIRTPETIWDVSLPEVRLWVERMGGVAVVKNPYSNAGQGVFTITHEGELRSFLEQDHPYDRFIVQSLIGNVDWSSVGSEGRLYHVGTVPDRHGRIFVSDLRFMVGSSPDGFFPVAIYARRAREALAPRLDGTADSWSMLGTNLSVAGPEGRWSTETERLLLMDSRDFNKLGVGLDDLIEAYIQSVMSMTAIDRMAQRLVNSKGRFRRRLFRSLNPDEAMLREIYAHRVTEKVAVGALG